ncbi:MAG: hypothetical protein KDI50_10580 [Candidatus Competibacteraceae bacterium]|nr:hypothetical protein [Candidatus Competibacteraceae bacterium]
MSIVSPVTVVVGLCGHGLTIARALHRSGVRVVALETNLTLPGIKTRCASIRKVEDINHAGLITSLLALADEIGSQSLPVLILTNDRMVETVGRHLEQLHGRFALSWSACHQRLLPLLRKEHIEARCQVTGLRYPRTVRVDMLDRIVDQVGNLAYPLIIKPTRPLSLFKTLIVKSPGDFSSQADRIAGSLPVIVQEFIPGDDRAIRFGALYLDQGRILARFEGRKLRSRPMGHTTLAVSEPHDEVHRLAARFFEGLALSGPVSLELKQAPDGSFWVIEPTVGRTDYWVGLCIANGINLPLIEYQSQAGFPLIETRQQKNYLWMNGERDPFALFWLALHQPALLFTKRVASLYLDVKDMHPFLCAFSDLASSLLSRILRKITNKLMLNKSSSMPP